jgi:hypothetical protein
VGQAEPRVAVIEGRRTLIVERRPPLPSRLDQLLASPTIRVLPVRVTGWRPDCDRQDHRLVPFAFGTFNGRELDLTICRDCEAVCVRDVSVDDLRRYDPEGRGPARPSSRPLRRRNLVLGWYSGARRNQREYR